MRSWPALSHLAWEMGIFVFPMTAEIGAFCCALSIKNSGLAEGSRLLLLVAAVKLVASIMEYKGYEEAYLGYKTGGQDAFSIIGWMQLLQGIIFPLGVLGFATSILGWNVPAMYGLLLLWVGLLTSMRQFLSYRWRVQLKVKDAINRSTACEIILAYGALLAISLASLNTTYSPILLPWLDVCWKLAVIMTLALGLWLLRKHGIRLFAPLSLRLWTHAVIQSVASQLGKECFILLATTDVISGFIARVVVTLYGLGVVYPMSFFRLRIFDRFTKSAARNSLDWSMMDSALRRTAFPVSVGFLLLSTLGSQAAQYSGLDFPFAAALIALAITYPIAAFDAMSYLSLLQQARRNKCTAALVAGGTCILVLSFFIARSGLSPGPLALAYVILLGCGDFVVNKVSRALAHK